MRAELGAFLRDLTATVSLLADRLPVVAAQPSGGALTHIRRYAPHYAVAAMFALVMLVVSPLGPRAAAPEATQQAAAPSANRTSTQPAVSAPAVADEDDVFAAPVGVSEFDATSPSPVIGPPPVVPRAPSAEVPSDDVRTAVQIAFTATMSVVPGLCLPAGPLPACQSAPESAFSMTTVECTPVGTFEGRDAAASPCGADIEGFVRAAAGQVAPTCAAFSMLSGNDSVIRVAGLERSVALGAPVTAAGTTLATGTLDGPDADESPVGDHQVAASIDVRPSTGSAQGACVTVPATAFDVAGTITIGSA